MSIVSSEALAAVKKKSSLMAEVDAIMLNTYHPGDIITGASATISWDIKNIGQKSFGDKCKLLFVSGDGLLVSQYNIPNAKPSETVKVTLNFTAFSTADTYETCFRGSSINHPYAPCSKHDER